jgi:RES domain-containing protein
MPFAYRITKEKYARDLSGTGRRGNGAYLNGGRWNEPGVYMLYTASSVALATLETLAHIRKDITPKGFVLVTLYLPDIDIPKLEDHLDLKEQWHKLPPYEAFTKEIGNTEVFKNHLFISVPSAVTLKDRNFLLNPLHQDISSVKIVDTEPYDFDQRLL